MARFVVPWLLLFCACVEDASAVRIESTSEPVVYGRDDRVDVYAHPDARARDIARRSVVALIARERLAKNGDLPTGLGSAPSLRDTYNVCTGERFENQPVSADCSGVLIADDLVLTAGHCFDSDDCSRYAFVFDFFYSQPNTLETIDESDVFACSEMIWREVNSSAALTEDFAVVRLDRPVGATRAKLLVRRGALEKDESLTVLGFPSGLPLKIDSGAVVEDGRQSTLDYFALDSDTFEGSSGSAVVDQKGRLAGVLVRGGRDYFEDADGGCARVRVLPDAERHAPWEQATYASGAIAKLCEQRPDVLSLCARDPICGDGLCEESEADNGCAVDCLAPCAMEFCRTQVASEPMLEPEIDASIDDERHVKRRPHGGPLKGGCSVGYFGANDTGLWLWALLLFAGRRRVR